MGSFLRGVKELSSTGKCNCDGERVIFVAMATNADDEICEARENARRPRFPGGKEVGLTDAETEGFGTALARGSGTALARCSVSPKDAADICEQSAGLSRLINGEELGRTDAETDVFGTVVASGGVSPIIS